MKLESLDDSLYLGHLYLGSPASQPVKVVFDTGSEFLAVTSSFCDDATTPEQYKFRKFDPKEHAYIARNASTLSGRCLNQAFNVSNSQSMTMKQMTASKVGYGSADL